MERCRQLTLDDAGNLIVDGTTRSDSSTFPAVGNVIRKNNGGGTDGFITKLDSDGNVLWNTYLGDSMQEVLNGIQYLTQDSSNMIAVAGLTYSPNLFSTLGFTPSIMKSLNGDTTINTISADSAEFKRDAFYILLTEPDSTHAMQISGGSFLGGSKNETLGPSTTFTGYGPTIGIAGNGAMYVAFSTSSKDVGDVNHGAAEKIKGKFHGDTDGILLKMSPSTASRNSAVLLNESDTAIALHAYPNPFTSSIILDWRNISGNGMHINLSNLQGQYIRSWEFNDAEVKQQTLELGNLSPGLYVIQFLNGSCSVYVEVVKE